jgi:capsular polysaccharide biosynthesis protein
LKIREQIALAGRARRIAGCSGSQMYLSAFQPDGGDNILIAPRNFLLRDDLLIGSLRSHRTAVVLGSAVDFDTEARSWEADLDAVQAMLRRAGRFGALARMISRRSRSRAAKGATTR